jgi:hypothetical protein
MFPGGIAPGSPGKKKQAAVMARRIIKGSKAGFLVTVSVFE